MEGLYTTEVYQESELGCNGQFTIDYSNKVFEGHFPGTPVVPGVCQVQIITDLVSKFCNENMVMCAASNIKYLNMMVPENAREVEFTIKIDEAEGEKKVDAELKNDAFIFTKIKARFCPVDKIAQQ